jgi:iron complex outermembrane receptor protein
LATALGSRSEAQTPPVIVDAHSTRLERRSARDAAADSVVIRQEELATPGTSTAQILSKTTGAQIRQSGGTLEPSQIVLRGGTSAQLPVYLGDVLLNDETQGATDLSLLPPLALDRIEVYRGHAPVFAEQLGMSGALVLEPRYPKGTHAWSRISVGRYGAQEQWLGGANSGATAGTLVLVGRSEQRNDYPYLDDRGTTENTDDDRTVRRSNAAVVNYDVFASGYVRPNPNVGLRFFMQSLDRRQGITGLGVIPARLSRGHTERQLYALSAVMPCHSTVPADRCRIQLSSQASIGRFLLTDPALELGYGSVSIDQSTTMVGERLRVEHRVGDSLRWGNLLSLKQTRLQTRDDSSTTLDALRSTANLGTDAVWEIDPDVTLLLLFRGRAERTEAAGMVRTTLDPTARIGTVVQLTSSVSLSGNVGRYLRTPTLGELYGLGPFMRGNDGLRPEAGFGEDVLLRYRRAFGPLLVLGDVSAYHQMLTDLVAWQRSSFGQIRPYNVGRARLLGSDLRLAGEWRETLRLETTSSFLDPRDTTDERAYTNDVLPYRSRWVQTASLDARWPLGWAPPWLRDAGVWSRYRHQSSRFAVSAGNAVLPASSSLDVGGRVALSRVPLSFRGQIANLLNQRSFDLLGMPLPGMTWAISAELDWELAP